MLTRTPGFLISGKNGSLKPENQGDSWAGCLQLFSANASITEFVTDTMVEELRSVDGCSG
jgi:hypothetical protein